MTYLTEEPNSTALQVQLQPDFNARPVLTNYNRAGNSFSMNIAMDDGKGGSVRLFPPGPCRDGSCQGYFNVQGQAADGTNYLIHVDVSSANGSLDPGSIYMFNPQPDPPGDFHGGIQINFNIANTTSATVSTTITVLSGNRVVPLQ